MAVNIVKHVFRTLASYFDFIENKNNPFGDNDNYIVEIEELPNIVNTNKETIISLNSAVDTLQTNYESLSGRVEANETVIDDLGTATGGGGLSSSTAADGTTTYTSPAQLTKMVVLESFDPTAESFSSEYSEGTIVWIKGE